MNFHHKTKAISGVASRGQHGVTHNECKEWLLGFYKGVKGNLFLLEMEMHHKCQNTPII